MHPSLQVLRTVKASHLSSSGSREVKARQEQVVRGHRASEARAGAPERREGESSYGESGFCSTGLSSFGK